MLAVPSFHISPYSQLDTSSSVATTPSLSTTPSSSPSPSPSPSPSSTPLKKPKTKPANSFFVFRTYYKEHLGEDIVRTLKQNDLSKLAGKQWRLLPDSDKLPFYQIAYALKVDFDQQKAALEQATPPSDGKETPAKKKKKRSVSGKSERRPRSRAPTTKKNGKATSKSPKNGLTTENCAHATPTSARAQKSPVVTESYTSPRQPLPTSRVRSPIPNNTSNDSNSLPLVAGVALNPSQFVDTLDDCLVRLPPADLSQDLGGHDLMYGSCDQNQKLQQQQNAEWGHFVSAYEISYNSLGKIDSNEYDDIRNTMFSTRPPNCDCIDEPFDPRTLYPALPDGCTISQYPGESELEWQLTINEFQNQNQADGSSGTNGRVISDELWSDLVDVAYSLAASDVAMATVAAASAPAPASGGGVRDAQSGWLTFGGASLIPHEDVPSGIVYDFAKHDLHSGVSLNGDNTGADMADMDTATWFPSGDDLFPFLTKTSMPSARESFGNL